MADEPSQNPEEAAPEAEHDDAADFGGDMDEGEEGPPPGGTVEELLHEAEANRRRANAAMSLVHKEHFAFLAANCLFFAGSLAAWRLPPYGENNAAGMLTHGLETIRGSAVFALSIYGFWTTAIGLSGLWIAAGFTVVTGFDYFRVGVAHLMDENR